MTLNFTLNGQPRTVDPKPGESLLDCLRERCDILSTKDGCQPQGQCGCCLALVDGKSSIRDIIGKVEHDQFIRIYKKLRNRFEEEGATGPLVAELQRILCDWFASHVMVVDTRLKECLEAGEA